MKYIHKFGIPFLLVIATIFTACAYVSADVSNPTYSITEPQQLINPHEIIEPINELDITGEIIVYYLDVGQGAASFIICDGKTMMIDGGGASSSNLIFSFLDRHGIEHIDYIINTHPHEDHVGGLSGALNKVSAVGTVYCSVTEYDTRAFESFKKYLDEHGAEITIPKPNDTFMLGSAEVLILAPNKNYNDVNNNSIVLKITYGETSFLFKGDAERQSEHDMIEAGYDLSATVLKVSHHGSETSTTYPFLREVMPEIAIISCGSYNQYGHPHDNTLSRLRDADVKVYRTDLQGDIIIRSDGKYLTVETDRNEHIQTNPTDLVVEEFTHIGNINSKKFHRPDCKTLPAEHNQVMLETRDHAIENGYEACQNCKP